MRDKQETKAMKMRKWNTLTMEGREKKKKKHSYGDILSGCRGGISSGW